jgi:hypothetical protein
VADWQLMKTREPGFLLTVRNAIDILAKSTSVPMRAA